MTDSQAGLISSTLLFCTMGLVDSGGLQVLYGSFAAGIFYISMKESRRERDKKLGSTVCPNCGIRIDY